MTQTTDGYLWLETPEGLFRFDGVRFVPFVPKGLEILTRRFASLLGFRDEAFGLERRLTVLNFVCAGEGGISATRL